MAEQKRVLIVEDERPLSKALKLKLEREGFVAEIAGNGETAIARADDFDLMLLDIVMPTTDGFEVLTELKEKGVNTPVLIVSNLSQNEDVDRAKELGAMGYIIKSDMAVADIVERVKEILS